MSRNVKKSYAILRTVYFAGAAVVTYAVWTRVSVVGNPWPSVVWFVIFATFAELLTVSMDEAEACGVLGSGVTPTSPILWTATAVLGPLPAVVVCSVCGILADPLAAASFHAAKALRARYPIEGNTPSTGPGRRIGWVVSLRESMINSLRRTGTVWEPKVGFPLLYSAQMNAQYVCQLLLTTGLSGLAYYSLGGQFLIHAGFSDSSLAHFVLPFLGMVGVAIVVEHSLHMIVMAAIDPIPGTSGLYGALLRMRMSLVEVDVPICRAQLFLVVVALMLSYLYAHIGVIGFVLAATPVVALRDFLFNWIREKEAYVKTITTLVTYMQHYHPYTRGHLKRVADMSERLARELRLPIDSIRHIGTAGFLHDIGKIGVSEEILDKPGKPSDEEWEKIKEHPVKGAEIMTHIEFLDDMVDWIKFHHKWYNGAGYPSTDGNGAQIPVEASIIGVVDAFDAMTDDRELALGWKCDSCDHVPEDGLRPEQCPNCGAAKRRTYREPRSLDDAMEELRRGVGSQFHPQVVKAFLSMVERDGIHLNA